MTAPTQKQTRSRTPKPRKPTDRALQVVTAPEEAIEAPREGRGPGEPIPGMKSPWTFRRFPDRAVVFERKQVEEDDQGKPVTIFDYEVVGDVPEVTGWVTKKNEEGLDTTIEYRLQHPSGRCVIVSEDELDRGTWAGKTGRPRPSGRDALQAFATVIRLEGAEAPEATAVPYMDDNGGMVLPEGDTQNIGYRITGGPEEEARTAWRTIVQHSRTPARTLLGLGAFFAAPLTMPLDLVAQLLNLTGPGQQGKSTLQVVQAGTFGKVDEGVLRAWNSSAQGITQILQRARFLPLALEENSTNDGGPAKTEQMMSSMLGGASRARGSGDGNGQTSLGRWRSLISSSSNLSLRRPGQPEDLASRLYELSAPFWPHIYVDAHGQEVPEGTTGAVHVSKWLRRTARKFHGWPLEWAVRAGLFTAEGIARLQTLHDEVCGRLAPKGGGIAGTIGEVYSQWVVGVHMLGEVLDLEGLGKLAEQEAARLLPDAITSAQTVVIPPGQVLWEVITGAWAKAYRFPVLDLSRGMGTGEAKRLQAVMEDKGSDVHGFLALPDNHLWIISDKLREVADKAKYDNLSAGLQGLKDAEVLKPGDGHHLPAKLPRALRGIPGLGDRMYRFDVDAARQAFDPEEEAPGGGPEGPQDPAPAPAPAPVPVPAPVEPATDRGADGTAVTAEPAACVQCGQLTKYRAGGQPLHIGGLCTPAAPVVPRQAAPQEVSVPAGTVGTSTAAPVRQVDDVPAPEAAPAVPATPAEVFLEAAEARKSIRTAPQREALAARMALLDDPAIGEDPGRLRLLDPLEGGKGEHGPFAPRRARKGPWWQPERPGMIEAVRVSDGWDWSREDYRGDVVVLDRNGSWPTAVSSVVVPLGGLEHTGALAEVPAPVPPGYYKVHVYPWTEDALPSPLSGEEVGTERWITSTRMRLLVDLAEEGRWPDASALDSYTSDEPVRLSQWAHLIGECRRYALEVHGRDSEAYGATKEAFGMTMGLLTGSWADSDGGRPRRVWRCKARRGDWVHQIKDQASATIWRTADAMRRAAPELAPLALRNVDELVIPAAALEVVTAEVDGKRPIVRLDELGTTFGTYKVKDTEAWGE